MDKKIVNRGFRSQRRPEVDLNRYYTIFLEVGLILTLLVFIGLTKVNLTASDQGELVLKEQEVVEIQEIMQTRQKPPVPPPPRPPVPVEVPNDEIIEDVDIVINSELDFSKENYIPPPPKPAEEDEAIEEEDDFFVFVEDMPELIGGIQSLQSQIKYPDLAVRAGIEGRVHLQFIINEKGEVEDPVVIRGIGGGADEEAIRVIKGAKFTPGLQRGRPVRVKYTLPISFRLN